LLRRFYRLYQEAHVPFFAAALAYYALLSLMPLLFLLVGLFGFLLSGNPALRTEVFQALTEPTRQAESSYAVFCLKKKKTKN